MDKKINTLRKLIETLIKLKRDSINFKIMKIDEKLEVIISDDIRIGFNVKLDTWILKNKSNYNFSWNPKLTDEDLGFLYHLESEKIMLAIQNYEEYVGDIYSKTNGITLETKFKQILHLLKFEENNIPQARIIIDDGIKFEIWYDFSSCSFKIKDNIKNTEDYFNIDIALVLILKDILFLVLSKALNKTFSVLPRKI